jgi:hypothetical protein
MGLELECQRTADEVQQWFANSTFAKHAKNFEGLDGKLLARLKEEQFQKELGNIQGSALFNAVAGMFLQLFGVTINFIQCFCQQ